MWGSLLTHAIVRANQKDAYFESDIRTKIQDVIHALKDQRFVYSHPEEITVFAKSLYLALTTLLGARTLGEEYVDLIYVNKSGSRLPLIKRRLGFVASYSLMPYIVSSLMKLLRKKYDAYDDDDDEDEDDKRKSSGGKIEWLVRFLSSYRNTLDTFMNLHIALFYFSGQFYSLSKRIFGLRYAFGHNKDISKIQNGNYSLLGLLIFLQIGIKTLIKFKTYVEEQKNANQHNASDQETLPGNAIRISKFKTLEALKKGMKKEALVNIDLSNADELPYIPEESRSCMLCLSPMVNPSAALCGHIFCWDCIVDWIREHPECPLCRQQCSEQNLLPLR